MGIIFLVDFDGTITLKDTCVEMTEKFCIGSWEEVNSRWERGEISTQECSDYLLGKMSFTKEDLEKMLDGIAVDPYFGEFLEACRSHNAQVKIVSDGYDFNISYILDKFGWNNVEYYGNKLVIDGNSATATFPLQNPDCKKCGNCKLRILKEEKDKGNTVIYIGDGYSDTCVAPEADYLFAKGSLLKYCRERGIPCIPYQDFGDIIKKMEGLVHDTG